MVICPVGLSTMQGGLPLFEAEAQSVGLPFCAAEAPSAVRHNRRLMATKRRLGKALPTRTSCFFMPKSSSAELEERCASRHKSQHQFRRFLCGPKTCPSVFV